MGVPKGVYAALRTRRLSRSQQLGLTTRFGMSLWRGELPVDSGRVLPTGWAEAGVLIGRKE